MINLIKVSATASTNTLLKELVRSKNVMELTCLWTLNQTEGRGQMGNTWQSQSGANLTFSIYVPNSSFSKAPPFYLNIITSLSIVDTLKNIFTPEVSIKWPNDILSANKKIGGVLIENLYQNDVRTGSIIGIGLNVNQEDFKNLPQANSLKNILHQHIPLEKLLNNLLSIFENKWNTYQHQDFKTWKSAYENHLFKKNIVATFQNNISQIYFSGIIQGVTKLGELQILEENEQLNCYKLKEIKLLY